MSKTLARTISTRLRARVDRVRTDRDGHAARVAALDTATPAQVRVDAIRTRRELQRLRLVVLDLERLHRLGTRRDDDGTDDPGADDTA